MPRRETRFSIERALADERRRLLTAPAKRRKLAEIEKHLNEMRDRLDPAEFYRVEKQFLHEVRKISIAGRRRRRRPGEGSMPALVEPPRGPKPLAGGAAAPLEFD